MKQATATSAAWTNWHWPEDVRAFAAQHGVEAYLEPLREASARVFPTAVRARVILELDPELRDDRHVTFEIHVPTDDVPDYVNETSVGAISTIPRLAGVVLMMDAPVTDPHLKDSPAEAC